MFRQTSSYLRAIGTKLSPDHIASAMDHGGQTACLKDGSGILVRIGGLHLLFHEFLMGFGSPVKTNNVLKPS